MVCELMVLKAGEAEWTKLAEVSVDWAQKTQHAQGVGESLMAVQVGLSKWMPGIGTAMRWRVV
jgi:hypothetical protein